MYLQAIPNDALIENEVDHWKIQWGDHQKKLNRLAL